MEKSIIPFVINKIRDPDNVERFRVVLSFEDVVHQPELSKEMIEIQEAYTKLIENCRAQLKLLESNRKTRGDPLLKWHLADTLYGFIRSVEKRGYYFANSSKALFRDLGISVRQVNYLIEFVQTFPEKEQLHPEISWDKYKEILDIKDSRLQEIVIKMLLNGKLKTREDIRKFKQSSKLSHFKLKTALSNKKGERF